jgi:acyl-CoA thioesterase I
MFIKLFRLVFTAFLCLIMIACSGNGSNSEPLIIKKPTKATTILVFGDSISQGYGTSAYGVVYEQITPGNTYTELLRNRLQTENMAQFAPITVINASLGSEFTDDALLRLPALLAQYKPTHVLLAHGTNDSGSDEPNSYISNNLRTMIVMAQNSGAKALIADVTFSLYGSAFAKSYSDMIVSLAATSGATYVGILNGVLANPKYYLPDGFHLNDLAQPIMMNNLWNVLIPLFD